MLAPLRWINDWLWVCGDQSGWSLMYLGNLYARLGDGERAKECLDLVARSCLMNNFFTTHNDWRDMGIFLNFDLAVVSNQCKHGLVFSGSGNAAVRFGGLD